MKTQFLTSVSHELRTPLNSIIGYTELVLSGTYGPLNETQENRLEKVVRNGQNLLNLINDVLDLNRIEAGHVALNPGRCPRRTCSKRRWPPSSRRPPSSSLRSCGTSPTPRRCMPTSCAPARS